jgi:vacuolar-type H+-ATPase subunit I/STV1
MWELIRANKRNSIILMVILAVVLLLLGFVIGLGVSGAPEGGMFGLMIATVIWLVLTLVSLSSGDQILLAASRAKPVTHDVHPQLFNVVEEMKIAAGLPKMPKIYIINDPAPNAFATGRNPENASVAVTAGLLARLNRDELQGVIAHEISHIVCSVPSFCSHRSSFEACSTVRWGHAGDIHPAPEGAAVPPRSSCLSLRSSRRSWPLSLRTCCTSPCPSDVNISPTPGRPD